MFFDVFRSDDHVLCLGPPMDGWMPRRNVLRMSDGRSPIPLRYQIEPPRIPEQHTSRLRVPHLAADCDTLQLEAGEAKIEIAIQTSQTRLLSGRRVLVTLSKDYPLQWIVDWATFHVRLQGADAVLLYDNGSLSYSLDDLAAALSGVAGLREVVVVDWPFRYGIDGKPGERVLDNYCQTGALDHARRCFCTQARSVLSLDIDELLPPGDQSIFEQVEASSHAVILFHGIWAEASGIESLNDVRGVRHRDCGYAWRSQIKMLAVGKAAGLCRTKWVAVPARCSPDAEWGVHDVYPAAAPAQSTRRRWRMLDRTIAYRHCRQINTGWKTDRWRSSADFDEVCFRDTEFTAALLSVFGDDTTERHNTVQGDKDIRRFKPTAALAHAEDEQQIFKALCLQYDRMLADITASRSWRVSRVLSAAWTRLPAALQRAVLRAGRNTWRSELLAPFRTEAEDEREIDELRKRLYSRLIPGSVTTDMWTGSHPKVSVVSSLFRSRAVVEPFLMALRNQDYEGEIEIVLVDDASPDNAGEAAEALADLLGDRFSLNIVRNAGNLGNCQSRNRGLARATGDYAIVIDPDCIVNRRFVRSHVHQHLRGFDVVLGPMGIESGSGNAQDLVETLERLGAAALAPRMRLQDASTPASGVNCVTRNFSVSREMLKRLGRPLFDERYAYRNSPDTGFGWEDVEMGASLRRLGARIAFSWDAFSVHVSHGSTVNDRFKARGSAKNFIRLIEEHPELLTEAPDWADVTATRIAKWQNGFEPPESGLSEIVREARARSSSDQPTHSTVYSAVAGGYDKVRAPRTGLAKRHVLYTDNADGVSGWEVRPFDTILSDPVRTAKAPKVLAHRYAGNNDWSVWIDGNVELIMPAQSLTAEVERAGCSIGVFRHPERYCAYDEGATCIERGKDTAERIAAQLSRYESEGFPRQYGLAECNVIVRRHNDPAVKVAMEIWWEEIVKGSRRDQLSFNYALWRAGLAYHELGNGLANVRSDRRFIYHLHG
jgi:GT2 family glycosyltransferase